MDKFAEIVVQIEQYIPTLVAVIGMIATLIACVKKLKSALTNQDETIIQLQKKIEKLEASNARAMELMNKLEQELAAAKRDKYHIYEKLPKKEK